VEGSSRHGPHVCTTGALIILSTEVNATKMVFCNNMSEPVRNLRKTLKDTASRDFMNFFRKPNDFFSASLVGLASRALITFFAVGLLSKNISLRLFTSVKLVCSLRGSDCKYRESVDRLKKWTILITYRKKILLKLCCGTLLFSKNEV